MEEHPGLEALLECKEQVTVDIRNHLDDVANYLRRKEIIGLQLFTTVTDVTSRDSEYTRARMVFKRLQDMVEGNEKYYVMFMEYLRSNPLKFGNSISILDIAYVDNGGILPAVEVNLTYSSPLAQGNSPAAHQATRAEFSIWNTEICTASHLTLIRYQDPITGKEKELRILDTIAPMWQSIGGIIGLPPAEITGIQSPGSGKTLSQCINGVITEWLQRAPTLPKSGRYPNTWKGLYNLLVDSKYGVAAKDLKDSLDAAYSDFHKNMDSGGRVQTQPQPPMAPVGGVEVQPPQLQQEPEPPAAPGKRNKKNKHELAEWLGTMGVDQEDVKKLRDAGVNEMLFLRLKEGDKFLNGISQAFLPTLDDLKAELRSLS